MSSDVLRILVALDGTPAAETILPALMPLARSTPAEFTLFRVATGGEPVEEARAYLDRMQGALSLHRLSASVDVGTGEPGPAILNRLRSGAFDFGAMTTHGRRGVDRILMGSVAESVLRSAERPLFLNRPDAKIGDWKRIVVALDGSPQAEEVLDDVTLLARTTGSTLYLVSVAEALVAAPGLEYSYVGVTLPDMKPYLAAMRKRLAPRGLHVETTALIGPPGEMITHLAGEIGAGLIALTTHGRSGLSRLVMGSVAEHVLRTAPCPVLVRPIGKFAAAGRSFQVGNPASR